MSRTSHAHAIDIDIDDADPAEDLDDDAVYDAPPAPPGVSADTRYMAQVYAHGTKAIIVDNRRRTSRLVRELRTEAKDAGPGVSSWLARTLGKLPASVQSALALGTMYLVMQLGGAVFERLTGHAPPQPTQPVSEAATATAHTDTP